MTCVSRPTEPVAGPSRLSLDLASCKLTEEKLTLDGASTWTMNVSGVCDTTVVRVVLRGAIAANYPHRCYEDGFGVEVALTVGGSTLTLGERNTSCTIHVGPSPEASQTWAVSWPKFYVAASPDGTNPRVLSYAPLRQPPDAESTGDAGVSPPNP